MRADGYVHAVKLFILKIFAVFAQSLLLKARTNSYVTQLKQVEKSCPSPNYVANCFFKQLSTV